MDNREKFNIKLMVDCEKQEPFYPATHAEAVKVIDDGLVKNLLDIIGTILNFIRNFNNVDLEDLLELGYTHTKAFYGDEGRELQNKMQEIYPASEEVSEGDNKPVTSNAVYEYVSNLRPDGLIEDGDLRSVSGDTIYDYIQNLINGTIEQNNNRLVTGGDIYNYLLNLEPNGSILSGETRAVTGDSIYRALLELEDNFWETDLDFIGSIKQKAGEDQELGLSVSNNNEVAIGKYNESNRGTIFSVGIGEQDNSVNGLEITDDVDNSLKIPFLNNSISILGHMRNELNNIKHITNYQLLKLDALINDKWKATWTFLAVTNGSSFLHSNTGITLKWDIKNSEGLNTNINIKSSTKLYQKLGNNYIDLGYTINNPKSEYSINNYNTSPLEFNFSSSGSNSFTFRMEVLTDEITPLLGLDLNVHLYAPSYIFHSVQNNLDSIPVDATPIGCSSLGSFTASVTINSNSNSNPNNSNEYIYIAFPKFLNVSRPTATNLMLKDKDSGFEFSLSTEYFKENNISKTFLVCDKNTTVEYRIIRSDRALDYGSTWNIIHK